MRWFWWCLCISLLALTLTAWAAAPKKRKPDSLVVETMFWFRRAPFKDRKRTPVPAALRSRVHLLSTPAKALAKPTTRPTARTVKIPASRPSQR
jgi:hypothetical protein